MEQHKGGNRVKAEEIVIFHSGLQFYVLMFAEILKKSEWDLKIPTVHIKLLGKETHWPMRVGQKTRL